MNYKNGGKKNMDAQYAKQDSLLELYAVRSPQLKRTYIEEESKMGISTLSAILLRKQVVLVLSGMKMQTRYGSTLVIFCSSNPRVAQKSFVDRAWGDGGLGKR